MPATSFRRETRSKQVRISREAHEVLRQVADAEHRSLVAQLDLLIDAGAIRAGIDPQDIRKQVRESTRR